MSNFVPPFIAQAFQNGKTGGNFEAATLFVDISGFTHLTESLMKHRKDGAEILADALEVIFDPLAQHVQSLGGIIPLFAGDAFVALHGSWNSSVRVGYGVERVLFDEQTGRPYGAHRVVTTLSKDGQRYLARPVDCAEAPDGSILFSCDATGVVYRITPAP